MFKDILFIGDSISLFNFHHSPTCGGYGKTLTSLLAQNNMTFDHWGGWHLPRGQCGNSELVFSKFIANIELKKKYKLVYWNSGLHDVKTDSEHVPLNLYTSNVIKLSKLFNSQYGARVIFATTTPVCFNVTRHKLSSINSYNANIKKNMPETILIHDLYDILIKKCGNQYDWCDIHCKDGIHLSPLGDKFIGTAVFDFISRQFSTI